MNQICSVLNDHIYPTVYSLYKELQPMALPAVLVTTKYGASTAAGLIVLGNVACVGLGVTSSILGLASAVFFRDGRGNEGAMEGAKLLDSVRDNFETNLKVTVGLTVVAVASHFALGYV